MIDLGANGMRTLINFEIQRIYAGWFDVLFKTSKEEVVVTASDAWGNIYRGDAGALTAFLT